ncbi:MAG: DNA replication/repair protein RecF [Candidatus Zipacnadales bacterium]
MQLTTLTLQDFRIYREARLELQAPISVIVGDNAQGKTSLLEAICALTRTKSHRTNRDDELIRWGADQALITGSFQRQLGGSISLRMVLMLPETAQFLGLPQKQLSLNNEPTRTISEVIGQVTVVVFSPDDLALAKGEPSVRRRFLNVALGQIQPFYLAIMQQYRRALRHRTELLSLINEGKASLDQLASWDQQVAHYGAEITWARANYTADLASIAARIHRELTQGEEELSIRYQSNVWTEGVDQLTLLEGILLEKLTARRAQENILRRTLTGPHRDDLQLEVANKELRKFGSQGQQRSAVLAMRLAEAELARKRMGEAPLVLLDDCLSELDENRASRVLEQAGSETQLVITTTHLPKTMRRQNEVAIYRVRNGALTEE